MPIFRFADLTPVIHPTAYIHPAAEVIGNVFIGPGVTILPHAVLRADIGRITIGEGSNIQDGCMVHTETHEEVTVGRNCTVGHKAILHGCTVRDGALVGMNAVVLDGAIIGEESIVAALAFVKAGLEIPPRSLVAGIPGRVLREVTDAQVEGIRAGVLHYQKVGARMPAELIETEPLTEPEPDRPAMPRH
jgi:carbonic anhydrase/acetyltransferase-like protein (isoleucine patch superfamily)